MRFELTGILSRPGLGWRFLRVIPGTVALLLTGCATSSFNPTPSEHWLPDGSLALVRPVPALSANYPEARARMRPPEMPSVDAEPRLIVETSNHTITMKLPGQDPVVVKASGAYALKKGSYSIALKQTDPLWYAPPTYFLRRGLKVPADGSKSRFMRGALGHQALFFDKQIAIHSGPIWNEEIGGIKLSKEDMARLFDSVTVGTKIEVR